MGKPTRRRLQPEARKLEIIEAAERLLAVDGSRVRVEDVVREAGIAKGTFFLYFPTWDDLLETVRQRLVRAFDATHPLPTEAEGPIDWPGLVESQRPPSSTGPCRARGSATRCSTPISPSAGRGRQRHPSPTAHREAETAKAHRG